VGARPRSAARLGARGLPRGFAAVRAGAVGGWGAGGASRAASNVTFFGQLAGGGTFNLNSEGGANYGLYADLPAYMRQQAGGEEACKLLIRSAES
jgi:hypothetical protein